MQVGGHTQQVLHKVLWSALYAGELLYTVGVAQIVSVSTRSGEWLYTAGVAKVLASALDAGELLYTVGVAQSFSVSTRSGEWLYTAGFAKVLASALDSGEWPYTAEVTRNVSISTRCRWMVIYPLWKRPCPQNATPGCSFVAAYIGSFWLALNTVLCARCNWYCVVWSD